MLTNSVIRYSLLCIIKSNLISIAELRRYLLTKVLPCLLKKPKANFMRLNWVSALARVIHNKVYKFTEHCIFCDAGKVLHIF